jgi:hypothetical protein
MLPVIMFNQTFEIKRSLKIKWAVQILV